MMEQSDLSLQLRQLLASTFSDPGKAKLLAEDAGLSLAEIDFSGAPNVFWRKILEEARLKGRYEALLDNATRKAPGIAELQVLRERLLGQPVQKKSSPGMFVPPIDSLPVQIAREICSGVSRPEYFRFIREHLLPYAHPNPNTGLPDDPFALDLGQGVDDDVWVLRESVSKAIISGPKIHFVIGRQGTGKTALCRHLGYLHEHGELAVLLDLADNTISESRESISLWLLEELQRCAFRTYFDAILAIEDRKPKVRRADLSQFRRDREWMERLRRLFYRLKPRSLDLINDHELEVWLRQSFQEPESRGPRSQVEELVRVITWRLPSGPFGLAVSSFDGVRFFIDGMERFSTDELQSVVDSIVQVGLWLPNSARVTVFCHPGFGRIVDRAHTERATLVGISELPAWKRDELRELLVRRLVGVEYPWSFNWAREWLQLSGRLDSNACTAVIDRLVDVSSKLAQEGSSLDAPIHLLRLVRGVLTLCGVWTEKGDLVTNHEVGLLIDAYKTIF